MALVRRASNRASAALCVFGLLIVFHPCFAPVSSEPSPSQQAELKMLALNDVALAHVHKAEYAAARSVYEEAIRLKPEPEDVATSKARRWVQTNLAWLLATCPDGGVRDGQRAVVLAEQVVASTPKDAAYLDTLAAAYAEVGRFKDAVKTQQAALAPLKKGHPLYDSYREHLKRYKDAQPLRDSGLEN
jgi:tetratricopeptide (TPR) repeat protein